MRTASIAALIMAILTACGLVYASATPAVPLPSMTLVGKYPALFTWVLSLAIVGLLVMVAIMLRHSVKNNEKQWEKIDNHEGRIHPLEVNQAILMREHDRFTDGGRCVLCGNKPHRRSDDDPCRKTEGTA